MASTNSAALEKPTGEYRQYLPHLNCKRFQLMCMQDAHEYAHDFKTSKQPPWVHALYMHWLELLQEPFKGVTTDDKNHDYCILAFKVKRSEIYTNPYTRPRPS
jgi:hypothetical protein